MTSDLSIRYAQMFREIEGDLCPESGDGTRPDSSFQRFRGNTGFPAVLSDTTRHFLSSFPGGEIVLFVCEQVLYKVIRTKNSLIGENGGLSMPNCS